MKLIELIRIIKEKSDLAKLTSFLNLNPESEVNLVYMEKHINLNSEICIFTFEETDDEIFYEKENILYIQLFALPDLLDLVTIDLTGNEFDNYSNLEIAEKIIDYRKYNA